MNKYRTHDEEYEVKKILIKHDVLHKDIDQLDDPILMQDLYSIFKKKCHMEHRKQEQVTQMNLSMTH